MSWKRVLSGLIGGGGGGTPAPATVTPRAGLRQADLPAFLEEIEAFQRLRPDLDPIRVFNHRMVDELQRMRPLKGASVLDIGASYRGYALERALHHRAALYVGVSLDISDEVTVGCPHGSGTLLRMNGERLDFEDASFDVALTLSTFEHFHDGARVLDELYRVLRPGGAAFVSFEPVWTSSYGHHLHHVPPVGRLIPPWAHLIWTRDDMRAALGPAWPADAPMTLDEAVHWVYDGDAINRVPIAEQRRLFASSKFQVEWLVPLEDGTKDATPELARYLARVLPYSYDELRTLGLSLFLTRG
jgi:SAM-dependent methyltransferase